MQKYSYPFNILLQQHFSLEEIQRFFIAQTTTSCLESKKCQTNGEKIFD